MAKRKPVRNLPVQAPSQAIGGLGNTNAVVAKGPRKVADVSAETIDALHRGTRETRNLVEALAIDPFVVASGLLRTLDRPDLAANLCELQSEQASWTFPKAVAAIGNRFGETYDRRRIDDAFIDLLAEHPSDVVRAFSCYAITARDGFTVAKKLQRLKPLAADGHFGVREFAWMAVRIDVIVELTQAIKTLSRWTSHADENVRRFASEATRPRGVWCRHLTALKESPEKALSILEPLRADPSNYVRLSVGNWLNDAAKTRPDFVEDLCARWLRESPESSTQAICRRALRTLRKG